MLRRNWLRPILILPKLDPRQPATSSNTERFDLGLEPERAAAILPVETYISARSQPHVLTAYLKLKSLDIKRRLGKDAHIYNFYPRLLSSDFVHIVAKNNRIGTQPEICYRCYYIKMYSCLLLLIRKYKNSLAEIAANNKKFLTQLVRLRITRTVVIVKVKVKVKCFRDPDASARVERELNPDFPPLSKH